MVVPEEMTVTGGGVGGASGDRWWWVICGEPCCRDGEMEEKRGYLIYFFIS